jgi:hypothetical protein
MLGRAVHNNISIFAGNSKGRLAFKIKMFLAA